MQDPDSGAMTRLNAAELAEMMKGEKAAMLRAAESARARLVEQRPDVEVGPAENFVAFSEGEEVQIKGAWFRIVHMRAGRMSLKPIARPK